MEPRSLKYIEESSSGELVGGDPQALLHRVCTDSREAQPGDLFIALAGENHDGHAFLEEAAAKGIGAAMVSRSKHGELGGLKGLPMILVEETRAALGKLAGRYREDFDIPIIAVGGSNGKTTVKEILGTVLRQRFSALWSEASFNNDIGVPLTLLRLNRKHEVAVLEAGSNHPGELAPLIRLIKPEIGVITSIGREHLEFFRDLRGVAEEQAALAKGLPEHGKLFLHGESPELEIILRGCQAPVIRIGTEPGNDWQVGEVEMQESGVSFMVLSAEAEFSGRYRIALLGKHQAVNGAMAIAMGKELGLTRKEIEEGLAECRAPKMRMELWNWGGVRVLDDCYNANADSMRAALATLRDFPCEGRRVAVLGGMAELGETSEEAHREVGRDAARGIDQLFVVGSGAGPMAEAARGAGSEAVREFESPENAAEEMIRFLRAGDVVLLKASRAARLERVGKLLRGESVGTR
jgi:UDP-N-acetylmuramoyl-tripeptide--D-alanyl-D-alanine ligase